MAIYDLDAALNTPIVGDQTLREPWHRPSQLTGTSRPINSTRGLSATNRQPTLRRELGAPRYVATVPRVPALGHHRRRPNRFAIVDNGSGRAVCGPWASSL